MKVLIDADGCPVVGLCAAACRDRGVACIILSDTAHTFSVPGAETRTFDKGADSVDFALVNLVQGGDIVVTQDYGLAAMCLARRATVLNQDGMRYTEENIDALLLARHTAKKVRNAGGRLKGPKKRTPEQDRQFHDKLTEILGETK